MNKKIVNATATTAGGIKFKSQLEARLYKAFIEEGITPQYEPIKFVIFPGFKPTIPFYIRNVELKEFKVNYTKQIQITYTPDFIFYWGKYIVIVEVKPGFTNDVYPYKRKIFRKHLEDVGNVNGYLPIYTQIGSIKEVKMFINILKNEYSEKPKGN